MSLLLDALRRAAAAKQGGNGDRYTVPRRDAARAAERSPGPGAPPADRSSADAADLDLVPREDDSGAAAVAPAPGAQGRAAQPHGAATARAVFRSTEGRRHGRLRLIGTVTLLVVAGVALAAGGGWYYYERIQQDLSRELARYDPGRGEAVAPVVIAEPASDEDAGAETVAGPADQPLETGADPAPIDREVDAAQADAADAAEAAGADIAETGEPGAEPEPRTEPQPQVDRAPQAAPVREARAVAQADDATLGTIRQASSAPPLERALTDGYEALERGDLPAAAEAYREALRLAPNNRDALLGSAAVARYHGDSDGARVFYARVLSDHPRDPYAQAGLLSLDGASDPRQAESELRLLLQEYPAVATIHFALGNVYAGESRWSRAQQSYFEAWRLDGRNPDIAFNLAVALDHLGQRDAAREHYQRALDLGEGRSTAFAPASARTRLEQLRE